MDRRYHRMFGTEGPAGLGEGLVIKRLGLGRFPLITVERCQTRHHVAVWIAREEWSRSADSERVLHQRLGLRKLPPLDVQLCQAQESEGCQRMFRAKGSLR